MSHAKAAKPRQPVRTADAPEPGFLSGQGGKLAAGAMLLGIIGLAGYFAVREYTRPAGIKGPEGVWFLCTACQREWMVPIADMPETKPDQPPLPPRDCPKCGKAGTAYAALQCPKCKQRYISQRAHYTGQARDVCPHCGQDFLQWFLDKNKR